MFRKILLFILAVAPLCASTYFNEDEARAALKEKLTVFEQYEKFGMPTSKDEQLFYMKLEVGEEQASIYMQGLTGEEVRLITPEPETSITGFKVSSDGRLIAYGISLNGSDDQEWRILDVTTGHELEDHIEKIKNGSPVWSEDGLSLHYARYDDEMQRLFTHVLGTPQEEDVLVYDDGNLESLIYPMENELVSVRVGCGETNQILRRLPSGEMEELFADGQANFSLIGEESARLWFVTSLDAPRGRIIAVDDEGRIEEIVSERCEILQDATFVGEKLACAYMKDAISHIEILDLDGNFEKEIPLPGIGTSVISWRGLTLNGGKKSPELYYSHTHFAKPSSIYKYNVETEESEIVFAPNVSWNPDDYQIDQVFVASPDGTEVPLFLAYKKGQEKTRPTLLYGYGGFEISMCPFWDATHFAWMESGGTLAVACLRGGGEYGKEWHQAGMRENKQNVFDDFIACGEWLIDQDYCTSDTLAITGRSNGGLLVGACVTQRPELFGAAIGGVGVYDMLDFHNHTRGWAWQSEFGYPDDPEDAKFLRAYSPLHNVVPGTDYPAILLTTADCDDRVVPLHSYKFHKALQEAQAADRPIVLRVTEGAGHGTGKSHSTQINERADFLIFLNNEINRGKNQ